MAVRSILIVLCVLLVLPIAAQAEVRRPSEMGEGDFAEYINPEHYTILGQSMVNRSLRDLQREIGPAEVYAVDHGRALCYQNAAQQLTYEVSVVGYGYSVSPKNVEDACGTIDQDLRNGMGLKLGLSKLEVLALLGSPSEVVDDNTHNYIYYVQEKADWDTAHNIRRAYSEARGDIWLDVRSVLTVNYQDGVVGDFSVVTTVNYEPEQ